MKGRRKLRFEQLGDRRVLSANPVAEFDSPENDVLQDMVSGGTLQMAEEEAEYDAVEVSGLCLLFTPGTKFQIRNHRSGSDEGAGYVVTSVQHAATEPQSYATGGDTQENYRNNFTCLPDSVTFRPVRITPRPLVRGPQSMVVVGPAGEEIDPDTHGRVKVHFAWERGDGFDENSSCWIRVSQMHAGNGDTDIPRVGEQLTIHFMEGDPDRPIIIGRVYNAEDMPPFGLPGSKSFSGLKSNTTESSGGYNEYVLDDTVGNELIREHGQFDKDSTVENDLCVHVLLDHGPSLTNNESIEVGVDRSETVSNNETTSIGNDRTRSVGNNETLSVGTDRTHTVGNNETITVTLSRTHAGGANEMSNDGVAQQLTVGAARSLTVGATQQINLSSNPNIASNHGDPAVANRAADIVLKGKNILQN